MWFKNLRVYQLTKPFLLSADALEEKLAAAEFQPCGKLDPQRSGFVSPLGRNSSVFVHAVSGYIALALKSEQRLLPSAVVNEELEERVAEISEKEGRNVGRKERGDLKDEIIFSLMPRAFTKSSVCHAYIDVKGGFVVVDAASAKKAEELLTALREAIGSFPCVPLKAKQPVPSVMTHWLNEGSTGSALVLGEECELGAPKDGRIIRVKNQELTADEVLNHLKSGMLVNKLALQWKEGVSFVIDEQFALKRLRFEDSVRERAESEDAESAEQAFDQEFSVMTIELTAMLRDVVQAFGGLDLEAEAA